MPRQVHSRVDVRKGDRVERSGAERTAHWPYGRRTVTMVCGDGVFVLWDGTHFEDEMARAKLRRIGRAGRPVEAADMTFVVSGG